MRGFRCVPVSLKYSGVMAHLTSFERDVVFSALVGQDDRHCLPYDAATLRSEIFPTRPFVAVRELANARDKLVALGVFMRKASPKKEWLEITPDYRHTEGRNETSFGDEAPPEQSELSLGPMLLPAKPARIRSPTARAPKINGSRAESEQSRAPESRASDQETAPSCAVVTTQELRQEKDSARFARGPDDVDDPMWSLLCRTLGLSEMHQNGAAWLRRYKLCRDALATAVSDYNAMRPESRAQWPAARYIVTAFEREKLKCG